ncbi:MAG: formate dehydrogenase subunit gamma [Gemmatimonadales bacterium]|mgnify:CR=1 FL=1|nr:formate dehydrogenase subunit gamma [Gemmatimonadales bacterium]
MSDDVSIPTPDVGEAVDAAVRQHRHLAGPLLPILHQVQETLGCVPAEAVADIAQQLNLSRAEVHGVVSFYHDFRETPAGRTVLRICRAESCQAVGAEGLIARAREVLGVDWHGTTPDGAVTLEPVYCLGNCALSPALTLGGRIHGRVTPEAFETLLTEARES